MTAPSKGGQLAPTVGDAIMAVPPAIGTTTAVILHSGPQAEAVSRADRGVRQARQGLTGTGLPPHPVS
ncbi:hypothetical protein [Streptomyces sp. NPDC090025]|uniref:hypothetical protein n=1 Tax=Streptomyces sp. NPDC090025 TaxID=3365922 RepID=UPI0038366134